MAKFLFVVPPFFGHINPTLSIGASLIEKGHSVVWTGLIPLEKEYIPMKGIYFYPEELLAPHKKEIEYILSLQGNGSNLSGLETLKLALEQTYIPFAKIMIDGVISIIEKFNPDVIINDCITFAGSLAAYKKGIPYATTTTSPPEAMGDPKIAPKVEEWCHNLIIKLQNDLGIYGKEELINSKELNMVFTSYEFAGYKIPPTNLTFIGPVFGRPSPVTFDWDKFETYNNPKIYVSLGTVVEDIRQDFFKRIVNIFREKPVTVIASAEPSLLNEWPNNFIVQKKLPQIELLQKVDVVISHGGFNTINESLINELPILVIPIAYDQFYNASLIEKSGCGIRLRYKRMKDSEIENAIYELLNNTIYKKAAKYIKQTFMNAGGNHKAVELLENLVNSNKNL